MSTPPNANQSSIPKFSVHSISDTIMEYWQLSHAVTQMMSYCTDSEKIILVRIRRCIMLEFFEKITQDSQKKWSSTKLSIQDDLEYWRLEEERRNKRRPKND